MDPPLPVPSKLLESIDLDMSSTMDYSSLKLPRPIFRDIASTQSAQIRPTANSWASFSPNPVRSARYFERFKRSERQIPRRSWNSFEVPNLIDDFYLNLLDWSALGVLSVGLGREIWTCNPKKGTILSNLASCDDREDISSISSSADGLNIAVGTRTGTVHIIDTATGRRVRSFEHHSLALTQRVAVLSWNSEGLLASGCRDKLVTLRDLRDRRDHIDQLQAHSQEVCGLKWSPHNPQVLASGGNDNCCYVWRLGYDEPEVTLTEHNAAVKAIAWSPHEQNVLATGGGTNDRCIRIWDVSQGSTVPSRAVIDTESQVCNIVWSRTSDELVSSHGYTLHHLVVWQASDMKKIASLSGHTSRVLYMAACPDGQDIATAAGDDTVRVWHVFPPRSEAARSVEDIQAQALEVLGGVA